MLILMPFQVATPVTPLDGKDGKDAIAKQREHIAFRRAQLDKAEQCFKRVRAFKHDFNFKYRLV